MVLVFCRNKRFVCQNQNHEREDSDFIRTALGMGLGQVSERWIVNSTTWCYATCIWHIFATLRPLWSKQLVNWHPLEYTLQRQKIVIQSSVNSDWVSMTIYYWELQIQTDFRQPLHEFFPRNYLHFIQLSVRPYWI